MPDSDRIQKIKKDFYFADTPFNKLMNRRINNVLILCSNYDAFMLEEDGRIDEQIFNEYVSLNLRYPPQFVQASSSTEAYQILSEGQIDLIINMLSIQDLDPFQLTRDIKARYPKIPIVVLTPFSREVSVKLDQEDLTGVDHVFCWLGNADLLLAIIKLIEDQMNVEHDVQAVGVQVIILVEDSIRFYSSYLPTIYKIIFNQSKEFMQEGLNEHLKMLRMRGRPKILLAKTYEQALKYYIKYKDNLLGIISDISYKKGGVQFKQAGILLSQKVKGDDPFMPILLQSSDAENEEIARELKVGFLHKNSKTLSQDLKQFIIKYFAFGDFVFLNPATMEEINRGSDLQTLQQKLFEIPDDSLEYHIKRNHFSKWLNARALFPLAQLFKKLNSEDFEDLDEIRRFLFDAIANFRRNKGRGIIADYNRDRFDEYLIFTRIGEGGLGGKARGLAFVDSMLKRHNLTEKYPDTIITIPRTVVLSTDVFDDFMEDNNLHYIAMSDRSDEQIMEAFVDARLPYRIHEDLLAFINVVKNPIAIRSSSLLEDSHYQPFAGIYNTFMIPKVERNERLMIEMLSHAIKCVYASVFYKDSKAYMEATRNVIDQEKMAIVLQEVTGKQYNERFYPTISGVARSINFYPIPPEKAEEGIADIALGLGKYIVDGGITLRFSPAHPDRIIQLTNPQTALRETQKFFYALDLKASSFHPSTNDAVNLIKSPVADAEPDGVLKFASSTYDFQNNTLKEGTYHKGKKVITYANILKHKQFPLAEILHDLLVTGSRAMNKPIEIEFAVNLDVPKGQPRVFSFLQIRPIVEHKDASRIHLDEVKADQVILWSEQALGNGEIKGLHDLVYVKPETFNPANTQEIAHRVGDLNLKFLNEKLNFVLVGPGRWGSSDPWLGIPVKWPQISAARLIVESGLENYRIDPSQGTHFFQNLTSFHVGYFTINPYINEGVYDVDFLNAMPSVYEDEFLRHIRFDEEIVIRIDGKRNRGVLFKPGSACD
ncbi:MAG TPA: PEP/pyruvate-binding domain-containing protein [Bacteroidales bacterium]|nr:PEP/pyruvate-binding domain-containing protein [Bacteroidales bacterium]